MYVDMYYLYLHTSIDVILLFAFDAATIHIAYEFCFKRKILLKISPPLGRLYLPKNVGFFHKQSFNQRYLMIFKKYKHKYRY